MPRVQRRPPIRLEEQVLSEDEPESGSSSEQESDSDESEYLDNEPFLLPENQISDDESEEESAAEEVLDTPVGNADSVDEGSDSEQAPADQRNLNLQQAVRHDLDPKRANADGRAAAAVDEYAHDSSDEEDLRNTIGNVPVDWYSDYEHIGYDWAGSKIAKPRRDDEVDDFMKKFDDPHYWRTVRDRLTGQRVVLTDADAGLLQRLRKGQYPDPTFNAHQDFIDFFTYEKTIHPVTNRPPTKAMFIPSVAEKRAISRLVSKIKRSWQQPKVEQKKKDERFRFDFDLWEKDGDPSKRQLRYLPAPKMKLPGHEESYNPPPEYLMTAEEETKWRQQEPEERRIKIIPKKYSSLRQVPAYGDFIKERFERCQDLYLCPRARKLRVNVNPDDLIPALPKPRELQPFPCLLSMVYEGHQDIVRSISPEPHGQFFVSGSDDRTVRVWEILTGRCLRTFEFEAPVKHVSWCPDASKCLVAVAAGKDLYLINPGVGDKATVSSTDMLFLSSLDGSSTAGGGGDATIVDWQTIESGGGANRQWKEGTRAIIRHRFELSQISWHSRGDYFAALMPAGSNRSVVIHQLSKRRSQVPFSKSKGLIQSVLFHASRPYFFVATQRHVRIYNLVKQQLSKKLLTNCQYVSCMAIHPEGDNVIVGSYEARLSWFDLDLSTKPYKTLRYHKKGIRAVAYHNKYPLFASAADDGSIIISHGMVYSDLTQNPLIVPVKVLHGHRPLDNLGALDCCFHPQQPWIFSAGADKTIKLFS